MPHKRRGAMDIIQEARGLMADDPSVSQTDALLSILIREVREVKMVESLRTDKQTAWHDWTTHIIVTFFQALGSWVAQWNPNPKKKS
jgi:hypothetical protein